jgi:hypothetical protein
VLTASNQFNVTWAGPGTNITAQLRERGISREVTIAYMRRLLQRPSLG